MTIRLPHPGFDEGTWGDILNDFLEVEHNADGTLKSVARPGDISGKLTASNNLSDVASVPSARTNLGLGTGATLDFDTDGTLAANSDTRFATQKAVKTYADNVANNQTAVVVPADTGVAATNTTNIQAALNIAANASNAKYRRKVVFSSASYTINDSIDMRADWLTVAGDGVQLKLASGVTNRPIVKLGGYYQDISGIRATYTTAPTSSDTASAGFLFYGVFMGRYVKLTAEATYDGFTMAQSSSWTTLDGSARTTNYMFSCTLSDWRVNGWIHSALYMVSTPGASTGSVFSNIYTHNNYFGTVAQSTGPGMYFESFNSNSLTTINIESVDLSLSAGQDGLVFNACSGNTVSTLHYETVTLGGSSDHGLVRLYNGSKVDVTGLDFVFSTIATSSNQFSVFRLANGGGPDNNVTCNMLMLRNNTNTSNTPMALVGLSTTTETGTATIDGFNPSLSTPGLSGPYVINDNFANGYDVVVRRINDLIYDPEIEGFDYHSVSIKQHECSSTTGFAPTAGTVYLQRQVKLKNKPIASGASVNLSVYVAQAGTGVTSLANCYLGLYRSDTAALIGVSSDLSSTFNTTGIKRVALTLSAAKPANVKCITALLIGTQSTTTVQFLRGNAVSAATVNPRVGAFRFALADAGRTSLPATYTYNTNDAASIFAGVDVGGNY